MMRDPEWVRCFNPRPSQPEGATAVIWLPVSATECFNPRPSQPEGATAKRDITRTVTLFQSTPLPTGRSDSTDCQQRRAGAVSIHAPPNRKERPGESGFVAPLHSFNPRPSQPEGATFIKSKIGESADVSIHAPPNRKERHWIEQGELIKQAKFQSTPLPTGRSDPEPRTSPTSSR